MSRIGKKPIPITAGVEVKLDGGLVVVKGSKGQLEQRLHPLVKAEIKDNEIIISIPDENDRSQKALWGLSRTLVSNLVEGVTKGFSKELEINGIGFKAAVSGEVLLLNVGFSHQVEFKFSKDIKITVEKNLITVSGIDKQKVGQIAAEIRAIKKPEPYKGKGIKYKEEVIRRKAGKVVKGSAG
ncbi:MAG: 50S ribosomal protein L6 [Patescibacteria group bacterium]|jgi:large subunit ribosomal protein L6